MRPTSFMTILLRGFESAVVVAVGLVLAVTVAVAVVELYLLLFDDLRPGLSIETLNSLQEGLQNVFGAVLLVLLGLELIDTLRVYFVDHEVRTEVILIVAMIAVGRHVIQVDFEHAGGLDLLGMAAVVVALAASFYLVKRSRGSADEVAINPGVNDH